MTHVPPSDPATAPGCATVRGEGSSRAHEVDPSAYITDMMTHGREQKRTFTWRCTQCGRRWSSLVARRDNEGALFEPFRSWATQEEIAVMIAAAALPDCIPASTKLDTE